MTTEKKNNIFTFLYCNRVKVQKDDTPILNLSLAFTALGVLTAPWLAVGGVIVALAMGYQFAYEPNAAGFSGNFDKTVQEAKSHVRSMMDQVVDRGQQPEAEPSQPESNPFPGDEPISDLMDNGENPME